MIIITNILYILACFLMILSIRFLSSPKTARWGNILGIIGMSFAIIGASIFLKLPDIIMLTIIILTGGIIGIYSGLKVKLTALPQMIAIFNGLGGLAAVCISVSETIYSQTSYFNNILGLTVGGIAFSGSMVAFFKLQGLIPPGSIHFYFQRSLTFTLTISSFILCILFLTSHINYYFYILTILILILGVLLVLPIGGADMPVIISILNACSGWACVSIGLSLNNYLLIILGSIVGTSGSILAHIMMKSMNRSLINILTGFLSNNSYSPTSAEKIVHRGTPQDAAFIMENSNKIIIIPGYGMAVAQAQHSLKTMSDILKNKYGVDVKFAIHPVAGRMPGHMNVLLAEANIDYNDIFELNDINNEFSSADVAYIIGANDITNPSAKTDPNSPLFGMPILEAEKAKTIFFVKRSLASGYSGVDNPLFYAPNTIMLYGDAQKVTEEINKFLENN